MVPIDSLQYGRNLSEQPTVSNALKYLLGSIAGVEYRIPVPNVYLLPKKHYNGLTNVRILYAYLANKNESHFSNCEINA